MDTRTGETNLFLRAPVRAGGDDQRANLLKDEKAGERLACPISMTSATSTNTCPQRPRRAGLLAAPSAGGRRGQRRSEVLIFEARKNRTHYNAQITPGRFPRPAAARTLPGLRFPRRHAVHRRDAHDQEHRGDRRPSPERQAVRRGRQGGPAGLTSRRLRIRDRRRAPVTSRSRGGGARHGLRPIVGSGPQHLLSGITRPTAGRPRPATSS